MTIRRIYEKILQALGLTLPPQASNPGAGQTLWVNSGDANKLYFGASEVGGGGSFSGQRRFETDTISPDVAISSATFATVASVTITNGTGADTTLEAVMNAEATVAGAMIWEARIIENARILVTRQYNSILTKTISFVDTAAPLASNTYELQVRRVSGTPSLQFYAADGSYVSAELYEETVSTGKIPLTSDTTFYIATTGNDSTGDGTVGFPWASLAGAIDNIDAGYDISPRIIVTISVAAGTYTLNNEVKIIHPWAPQLEIIGPDDFTTTFQCVGSFPDDNMIRVDGVTLRKFEGITLDDDNEQKFCMRVANGGIEFVDNASFISDSIFGAFYIEDGSTVVFTGGQVNITCTDTSVISRYGALTISRGSTAICHSIVALNVTANQSVSVGIMVRESSVFSRESGQLSVTVGSSSVAVYLSQNSTFYAEPNNSSVFNGGANSDAFRARYGCKITLQPGALTLNTFNAAYAAQANSQIYVEGNVTYNSVTSRSNIATTTVATSDPNFDEAGSYVYDLT